MPVDGPITAEFNKTDDVHTEPHSGVDIAANAGTPVLAPADGTVAYVSFAETNDWSKVFGNSVILDHGDCLTLYAHLRDHPTVSDVVKAGDVIGLVGSTGQSSGPHLHWGMAKPNNRWFDKRNGLSDLLNPLDFLAAAGLPVNTNMSPGPWDIGDERLDDEVEFRLVIARHKKHAGDPKVLHEIIDGKR